MHLTRCQRPVSMKPLMGSIQKISRATIPSGNLSERRCLISSPDCGPCLTSAGRSYGLTSHWHLCLLATDTGQSPWFVKVVATDRRNYHVSYRMPERLAPWRGAYVHGDAESEDEAVRMILIAMGWSGGWSQLGWNG